MQNGGSLKAVVTGGAGFIGSHIAEELLEEGYRVTAIDDLSTGSLDNLSGFRNNPGFEFVKTSVAEKNSLEEAFKGACYIFHQAALPSVPGSIKDPRLYHLVNLTGTLNVLEAARQTGVRKVVFASSCAVYGNLPALPKQEEMPPAPLSPYAAQKLAAEYYCGVYTSVYNLPAISLRYFNVYGPRQAAASDYAAVIPKFIKSITQGKPPIIFGDGTQTRDFVFVKDVARANILAAESDACGVYNIASGQSTSLNQLAGLIAGLAGKPQLEPCYQPARPGDVLHSAADITRAARAFAYRPQYSLEEGLSALLT